MGTPTYRERMKKGEIKFDFGYIDGWKLERMVGGRLGKCMDGSWRCEVKKDGESEEVSFMRCTESAMEKC
jgi:hypothetical protein